MQQRDQEKNEHRLNGSLSSPITLLRIFLKFYVEQIKSWKADTLLAHQGGGGSGVVSVSLQQNDQQQAIIPSMHAVMKADRQTPVKVKMSVPEFLDFLDTLPSPPSTPSHRKSPDDASSANATARRVPFKIL